MRTFFGMILGCLLTIGIVYLHDVRASSDAAGGATTTTETRQIVNWSVAAAEWNKVTDNVRQALTKVKESVRDATT